MVQYEYLWQLALQCIHLEPEFHRITNKDDLFKGIATFAICSPESKFHRIINKDDTCIYKEF